MTDFGRFKKVKPLVRFKGFNQEKIRREKAQHEKLAKIAVEKVRNK